MKKEICKKIKELRLKNGYSQQAIAETLCMSQNAYSEMETGKTKMDIEKLYALAEFFKVPIQEFLPDVGSA